MTSLKITLAFPNLSLAEKLYSWFFVIDIIDATITSYTENWNQWKTYIKAFQVKTNFSLLGQ